MAEYIWHQMEPHEGLLAGEDGLKASPVVVLGRGLACEVIALVRLPSCYSHAVKCVLGALSGAVNEWCGRGVLLWGHLTGTSQVCSTVLWSRWFPLMFNTLSAILLESYFWHWGMEAVFLTNVLSHSLSLFLFVSLSLGVSLSDGPCAESSVKSHLWRSTGEDQAADHLLQRLPDPLQLWGKTKSSAASLRKPKMICL